AGQSNPTFLIQTPSSCYVLRKKPPGELLPGAHKVDREYWVQRALFSAGFPVPQPLLHCTDVEVIGTEFYMMEHVKGRIFRDLRLPGVSAAERTALYVAAVEVLAKLHSLDLASLNLEGYGKGSGYCRRQVSTWTKQYTAAAHRDIPAMTELSDWLLNNLPANDDEVTLVHGDFRIDNLIFHPTEARVIAVLDWELSTTGQPLADLAYFLMPHYWPTSFNILSTMGSLKGIEAGIPTVGDLISIYCRCRGIPSALPQLNFYLALSVFKMAGIAQGVYARHLLGNASAPNAAQFSQYVEPLAKVALQLAQRSLTSRTEGNLFLQTAKGQAVLQQVKDFMRQYVLPAQQEVTEYYSKHAQSPQRWHTPQIIEDLKVKARKAGLWNLFLPAVSGLSQLDYAYIAEETGRCLFAPDVFNCQAPDTGNMEVLHMFGSEEQKKQWLEPLLRGEIRSCFCMTEPDVASSDATNMECTLHKDGDDYVVNGKKWWSSGMSISISIRQLGEQEHSHHGQQDPQGTPLPVPPHPSCPAQRPPYPTVAHHHNQEWERKSKDHLQQLQGSLCGPGHAGRVDGCTGHPVMRVLHRGENKFRKAKDAGYSPQHHTHQEPLFPHSRTCPSPACWILGYSTVAIHTDTRQQQHATAEVGTVEERVELAGFRTQPPAVDGIGRPERQGEEKQQVRNGEVEDAHIRQGAGNPKCKVAIVMCRSSSQDASIRHAQHSMILVPVDTPGLKLVRPLTVFGQDDAIHGGHFEVHFENVRVPASNIILGEGRGFEIAQGRLGPGRLHHCMRAVGLAELALELLCQRAASRRTFGKKLYQHEVIAHWIAECRLMIEQTRLLTLHAAHALDTVGSRAARKQIAMIKVAAGRMACKVVDCAIQVYGGAGVSGDVPLAQMYSYARTLRIADGPDEVHLSSIALLELRDQLKGAQAKL
ncbi:hypothetical protein L3Q82_018157, partial [Scortum barcoo]